MFVLATYLLVLVASATEVSYVEIPESLGLWRSMQWCSQGLIPSIQRIASTLMTSRIPPYVVEMIKNEYFGIPQDHARDGISDLYASKMDDMPINPLQTMMSIAPLVSDLVLSGTGDDVKAMAHSEKLETYSERLCRLVDAEAVFSKELHDRSPISCALIDLVQSVVACGAAVPDGKEDGGDDSDTSPKCVEGPIAIKRLPDDAICEPAPSTFQAQAGLPAFHFNDPSADIPLTLERLDHIPQYIPDAVRQKELLTYLTLYRANQMLSHLARINHDHTQCAEPALAATNILPGWKVVQIFNAVEVAPPEFGMRADEPEYTPYALLFQRKVVACQFAVGVRGSKTLHEWTTAFDLARNDDPFVNGTHAGTLTFVSALLPSLMTVLERETAAANCSCHDTEITFFGHSLGGSVSQILSLAVGERLKSRGCAPQVNGVFFAPLRMFNRKQVDVYRKVVNSRHITDMNDGLHHFPCFEGNSKYGFPRCNSDFRSNIIHAGAFSKVGRDYYVENPSQILLNVDYRAMRRLRLNTTIDVPDTWFIKEIQQTYPMLVGMLSMLIPPEALAALPTRFDLNSAHICSHACALSAGCVQSAGTFRWWCESCTPSMLR